MSPTPRRGPPVHRRAPRFAFLGGRPCIDLLNTVAWRGSGTPVERLASYGDLVRWSRQAGLVSSEEAVRLGRAARERRADAEGALCEARALREALYEVLGAVAARREPTADALSRLGQLIARTLGRGVLVRTRGGFRWAPQDPAGLDPMLWRVARSAVDLLLSRPDLGALRACGAPTCGWMFLDQSRNGLRRWCRMSDCGNREKARRHRARARRERYGTAAGAGRTATRQREPT